MALYNADLAGGGSSVEIDGVEVDGDLKLKKVVRDIKLTKNIPFEYKNYNTNGAITLNDEIHLLNSNLLGAQTKHYKFNGETWTSVSTLPDSSIQGMVVLNEEIHIFFGNTKHYKFNGETWTSVSTLPVQIVEGNVAVLNGEIYYVCTLYAKLYKFNGSTWTCLSTTNQFSHAGGHLIAFNNEIHLLGGNYYADDYQKHYKFNGSQWVSVETISDSYITKCGGMIVHNDEIHSIGGTFGTTYSATSYHYKYDGETWTKLDNLPMNVYGSCGVGVMKGSIFIFGSGFYLQNTSSSGYVYPYSKMAFELAKTTYELAS